MKIQNLRREGRRSRGISGRWWAVGGGGSLVNPDSDAKRKGAKCYSTMVANFAQLFQKILKVKRGKEI